MCVSRWGESGAGGYRYRYNGKELNEELGLYDYGARWYDPAIGRFTTIDPHADSYGPLSPYSYVANNPLIGIDPDGKDIVITITGSGENLSINIAITGVLVDRTGTLSQEQTSAYRDDMVAGWAKAWGGIFGDAEVDVDASGFQAISNDDFDSGEGVSSTDNLVFIKDQSEVGGGNTAAEFEMGGEDPSGRFRFGSVGSISLQSLQSRSSEQIQRTMGHEFGHWLGFDHPDDENGAPNLGIPSNRGTDGKLLPRRKRVYDNIMYQSRLSNSQRTTIQQRWWLTDHRRR